jgi:tetratricopeptide (TPR) repeat protein
VGDNTGALAAHQDAFLAAEAAADDALAARAAAGTAFVLVGWLWRPQDGERWIGIANAIAERVGHDDVVEAEVLHSRIVVMAELGHPEQTLEAHEQEIATLERLYGERSPRLAIAFMNKGISLSYMGKPELGIPALRRGAELFESIGGPDNPQLDLYYANLGTVLQGVGAYDEARETLLRGIAVQGDQPPGGTTVLLYGALAALELETRGPAAALEYVRKGMAVADALGEGGAKNLPVLMFVRGLARARMGDASGSAEDCGRLLSMQEAHGGIDLNASYGPDALRCLGEAELSLHRVSAAIEHLERSVALQHRQDPGDLEEARFALARALRVAHRDGARAEALAQGARNVLRGLHGREKDVAAIDQWLREPAQ